jgi:16S rRNA (cytidine1402-2'-O)-methyltransferase
VTHHGSLYLLPVPLGDVAPARVLPSEVIERVLVLDAFIAENAKSARAFLKSAGVMRPLTEITIDEIDSETPAARIETLLAPLLAGRDLGLLSEAGCPGVADPGAGLVRAAHRHGIVVHPMVGPSSLLLGLMASGLNGQSFAFCGYLPVKENERTQRIRELETHSRHLYQTQIFIETPYRNAAMFAALLQVCSPATMLTVARELTLAQEWIGTRTIAEWRSQPAPDLARRPTVFLLQG